MPRGAFSRRSLPSKVLLRAFGLLWLLGISTVSPGAGAEADALQALRLRGLTARPAALLMSGQAGGDVPLAVLALPIPVGSAGVAVAVVVEAPLAALGSSPDGDLRAEVYVYATDASGAPRDSLTQVFSVPEAARKEESGIFGIRFLGHLELEPGDYDLRVLLVGETPERFGLYRSPLQIPGSKKNTPVLLPPLVVSESTDGWLEVREAPHGTQRGDLLEPLGLRRWPAARPVLPAGWEGEVLVLGQTMGPLPGDLSGILESPAEEALGRVSMVSSTLGSPGGGFESWRLAVRLEAAGSGLARWRWETSMAGTALPPAREVWLAEGGTGPSSWAKLQTLPTPPTTAEAQAAPSAAPPPPQKASDELRDRELRAFSRSYSGLLREVAEGNRDLAMTQLIDLEAKIVTGRSLSGVEALREAELAVLRPLAAPSAEAYVPVVWLYLDLFERYLQERQFLLAAHARVMAGTLLDLYVAAAPGESSKKLAADLFAVFGGALQAASQSTASEVAFRRAVELDATQTEALRGLVASYERARQDDSAIIYLEKLTRLRPADTEACVRLGRIQLREDRKAQAEEILRSCVEKNAPEWALAVAFQELALLLGRDGRWPAAAEVLDEATRRLPSEPRLQLLRAYALDRVQRPAAGRHAVARLQSVGPTFRDSPRARYGRWPRELFALLRRSLVPEVDRRREVLADALRKEKK